MILRLRVSIPPFGGKVEQHVFARGNAGGPGGSGAGHCSRLGHGEQLAGKFQRATTTSEVTTLFRPRRNRR